MTKTSYPWIGSVLLASASLSLAGPLDFDAVGQIAIQAGGRKKPLDTYAAESLQLISGRRTWQDATSGTRRPALDFVCALWLENRPWHELPVILVSDPSLKRELGMNVTDRWAAASLLTSSPSFRRLVARIQEKRSQGADLAPLEQEAERVLARFERLESLAGGKALRIVPANSGSHADWQPMGRIREIHGPGHARAIEERVQKLAETYRARDPAGFSRAGVELRSALEGLAPGYYPAPGTIAREIHYNRLHPFRWAWVLYVAAFFLLLLRPLRGAGRALFLGGIALQAYGFLLRCRIAGYAPVTNMYESVVWVSLGVAVFAYAFSLRRRTPLYLATAAPIAVLGLIVADLFPAVMTPSIGPLPPVLRDNFWLVTHVLTITLGYAALALAMGVGHVILARAAFGQPSVFSDSPLHDLLRQTLQIGILLLAAGTILGGVWAYYSWGRFWGWDPKETWALIALLFYIFALHGRLAGWWGTFGLSVAAVVCFNSVLMAWYGVNFVLGKGLHSYGFGGGNGARWVGALILLDLLFVAGCAAKWRMNAKRTTINDDLDGSPSGVDRPHRRRRIIAGTAGTG